MGKDNTDDYEFASDASGLRAQLEKVLARNKVLENENSSYRAKEEEQGLQVFLNEKGVTQTKVIKWAKDDKIDVTDQEAFGAWLEENGFAGKSGTDSEGQPAGDSTPTGTETKSTLDPDKVAQAGKIGEIVKGSTTPTTRDEYLRELDEAKTPADVFAIDQKYKGKI